MINKSVMNGMTLDEYLERLNEFDWFFEMSDDHQYWKKKSQEYCELENIAEVCGGKYALAFENCRRNQKPS